MNPYSQDLREKIIQALEAQEETQSDIADRFAVSLSFVKNSGVSGRQPAIVPLSHMPEDSSADFETIQKRCGTLSPSNLTRRLRSFPISLWKPKGRRSLARRSAASCSALSCC